MKKFIFGLVIIIVVAAIAGSSWELPTNGDAIGDNNPAQKATADEWEDDEGFEDQASMSITYGEWYQAYMDSIEGEFQMLVSVLPQYRNEFEAEKAIWLEYHEAVREVADCEEHGSSTPMYIHDVLWQSVDLWSASFKNLLSYEHGRPTSFSKTTFSAAMITDAYSAFIEAVGQNEYVDKNKYQESLRKEQRCWNKWMRCRASLSEKLSSNVRKIYDGCTNLTMRTKLLQLKNQNNGLGIASEEVLDCVLPDDCSDKALLEYPGFDVAWAKHCKDLDWYPDCDNMYRYD